MTTPLLKDSEYSDNYIDVSKNEKRLVRVSSKTYEQTGTYVSLKLFKRETKEGEFQFSQRATVSLEEFQAIIDRLPKIKRMLGYNTIKPNKMSRPSLLSSRDPVSVSDWLCNTEILHLLGRVGLVIHN